MGRQRTSSDIAGRIVEALRKDPQRGFSCPHSAVAYKAIKKASLPPMFEDGDLGSKRRAAQERTVADGHETPLKTRRRQPDREAGALLRLADRPAMVRAHSARGWGVAALLAAAAIPAAAQGPMPPDSVAIFVARYKADPRGPYQGIRWFCPDGTIRPATDRCPDGHQHALHAASAKEIARRNGIHLGQILADTPYEAFLDEAGGFGRLKQYQIERYLRGIDDGWVLRRAQYYRGAMQAEDEDAWGRTFLSQMLSRDSLLVTRFLLCRDAVRDLPHRAAADRMRGARILSRAIGDSLPSFADLRTKIHARPGTEDIDSLRAFRARSGRTADAVRAQLDSLDALMAKAYGPPDHADLARRAERLAAGDGVVMPLRRLSEQGLSAGTSLGLMADALWTLREALPSAPAASRLGLMDLSLDVEAAVFRTAAEGSPETVGGALERIGALARAAVGCGYLEPWEWAAVAGRAEAVADETLPDFVSRAAVLRRLPSWGAAMVRTHYGETADRFISFEPLAGGFVDDRVRGSLLLPLGEAAARLGEAAARRSLSQNDLQGVAEPSEAVGLNPGFARGVLEVPSGVAVAFRADRIYALAHAPADLKPVAGVLTVSEGNAVSHVQLLARNLGIPNARASARVVADLSRLAGREVFFAVSPRGRVVLKPAEAMTEVERVLFDRGRSIEGRIEVPTSRLDLQRQDLPMLSAVRAADSGRLCGPKAANLGELQALFPERVAPGLVIPFGVFRAHLGQAMPFPPGSGAGGSYAAFLRATFEAAAKARAGGRTEQEVEGVVLPQLAVLREAIRSMPFLPGFVARLDTTFAATFGAPAGEVAVFVRSDTNMEDLKDFVGAGLNLTVPNVVGRDSLLAAIRAVWASPYTERSYRWRQRHLLNPEHVYPSLLLLQSVPVEKSGVMVTTGVGTGAHTDLTVAFNRGVGGAVEGQAAESHALHADGTATLLSPAREPFYTVLPETGGVSRLRADFSAPILTAADLTALREIAREVQARLPGAPGISSPGPFDVELGFRDGQAWLFQVRPFVESRRARTSDYLSGLDPWLPTPVLVRATDSLGGIP